MYKVLIQWYTPFPAVEEKTFHQRGTKCRKEKDRCCITEAQNWYEGLYVGPFNFLYLVIPALKFWNLQSHSTKGKCYQTGWRQSRSGGSCRSSPWKWFSLTRSMNEYTMKEGFGSSCKTLSCANLPDLQYEPCTQFVWVVSHQDYW